MAEIKDALFYSKDHEWIRIDGNVVRMGISDYAQQSLGDITYIELPTEDESYRASDIIANVESVKAASDIYAPISGTVRTVNMDLEEQPELINSSAYDNGWICEIAVEQDVDTTDLMSATEYADYIKTL